MSVSLVQRPRLEPTIHRALEAFSQARFTPYPLGACQRGRWLFGSALLLGEHAMGLLVKTMYIANE
jgi:hypothetical protein